MACADPNVKSFEGWLPPATLAACAAGPDPATRAMYLVHAAVRHLGQSIRATSDAPESYSTALAAACAHRSVPPVACACLLRLLGGEDRVYTGYEAVAQDEVWHQDVPGDGSCLLTSIMASFFVQRSASWPDAAPLFGAAQHLRIQLLEAVLLYGDLLLSRRTLLGCTLRARVVTEYAHPDQVRAAAALHRRSGSFAAPTWTEVMLETVAQESLAEEEEEEEEGEVVDLDGDFLDFQTVHSLLVHSISQSTDWCGTVELDLLAHLSRIDPAWGATDFCVYQLDRSTGLLREVHAADGRDYSTKALVDENIDDALLRIPIFSNGQNHVCYAGKDGEASHFSCLVFRADVPAKTWLELPPPTPFITVLPHINRCPVKTEAVLNPTIGSTLTDLLNQRRTRVCGAQTGLEQHLCPKHTKEFGSAHRVPLYRTASDASPAFLATQKAGLSGLGISLENCHARESATELYSREAAVAHTLNMVKGTPAQRRSLNAAHQELALKAGPHEHLTLIMPTEKGPARNLASRLIVILALLPALLRLRTVAIVDPLHSPGLFTLVERLTDQQKQAADLPRLYVIDDPQYVYGASNTLLVRVDQDEGILPLCKEFERRLATECVWRSEWLLTVVAKDESILVQQIDRVEQDHTTFSFSEEDLLAFEDEEEGDEDLRY
jgi:hypothetical protein